MLEDYFSLQLKFASHYAAEANVPLDLAIARCTNLRRRLNLWGPAGATRWNLFLAQVRRLVNDHPALLSVCAEHHQTRPDIEPERSFGCFSYDPPDAAGTLRIHFLPPRGINSSPLALANVDARVADLQALFSHVHRTEPKAASVLGISWLYNLHAYRRLFPSPYAASVQGARFPLHLNGSSTWGQVLNWRQEVKLTVGDHVLTRLPDMNVEAHWQIFPLQAMVATGEIEAFYDLFT